MPLQFSSICHLLSDLEDIELHDPPFIKSQRVKRLVSVTEQWFRSHRTAIDALSVDGATALLSALLPEWRTDRVYGLQAQGLCRTVGRLLNLGGSRLNDLQAYRQPGRGDLAECLERVQRSGGVLGRPALTLQEVDDMLESLAGRSRFSDKSVIPSSAEERNRALGSALFRASPAESKWLVRLLLKDYSPVRLDQDLVLRCFHFLLPDLLRFQRDFKAAVIQLKGPLSEFPVRPDPRSEQDHRRSAANKLRPEVGVKVGRPEFTKCRGIDHCMKMARNQPWILERKYDGEYCEIHINLTLPRHQWIKIYSKSGKDSTEDREGIHSTLIDCLHLGGRDCKIKRQAVLLGELVVYSDRDECILPFEKIRKHVKRSARFIGTDMDSQAHPHEHLAVVFFDLLLWDDKQVMTLPVDQRRLLLRQIYTKCRGRAMSADWKILDFSDGEQAKRRLIQQFAASNAQRCEGLILKPLGVPYFALDDGCTARQQCIKLKKDYIDNLGDEADFAVVGASYNAQVALKRGVGNLRWTSFHLACLLNKSDVERFDERPRFRYVVTIEDESCIPIGILKTLNSLGAFVAEEYLPQTAGRGFDLDVRRSIRIDCLFSNPFVCEVLGSDYVKPSNCDYLMLRHPRIKKLHEDRGWKSCISFHELQAQAAAARTAPTESESQETRMWVEKLEQSCKRKLDRERSASRCRTKTPETQSPLSAPRPGTSRKRCLSPIVESDEAATTGPVTPTQRTKTGRREVEFSDILSPASVQTSSPLSEITNQARIRGDSVALISLKGGSMTALRASGLWKRVKASHTTQHVSDVVQCGGPCLFSATVVLLAPCIRGYLYVSDDLLPTHDVSVVDNLNHWDRDSFSRTALSETVSESQAYPGLRKIVLVEGRRRTAVLDILEDIRRLNGGRLKERIDIYDWRVLEDCKPHNSGAESLEHHFIGAAIFDDNLQHAVLISDLRRTWK